MSSSTEPVRSSSTGVRRVAIAVAVVVALLLAVLLLSRGSTRPLADSPLVGRPAPAAKGVLADGSSFVLGRRKGSWVVLNFFSHDCVPCIREHPELVRFVAAESVRTDGVEFYSVVQRSTQPQVEQFFADFGGDWPHVYDTDFDFQVGFGVAQVPETWVIDPDGVVRSRFVSTVTANELSNVMGQLRGVGSG